MCSVGKTVWHTGMSVCGCYTGVCVCVKGCFTKGARNLSALDCSILRVLQRFLHDVDALCG